jgi:hypothetical protein
MARSRRTANNNPHERAGTNAETEDPGSILGADLEKQLNRVSGDTSN